jgi:hypothetical protein
MGQSERNTEQQSDQIYYTLFVRVHTFVVVVVAPFTSHRKLWNYAEPKTIFLIQPGIFFF